MLVKIIKFLQNNDNSTTQDYTRASCSNERLTKTLLLPSFYLNTLILALFLHDTFY